MFAKGRIYNKCHNILLQHCLWLPSKSSPYWPFPTMYHNLNINYFSPYPRWPQLRHRSHRIVRYHITAKKCRERKSKWTPKEAAARGPLFLMLYFRWKWLLVAFLSSSNDRFTAVLLSTSNFSFVDGPKPKLGDARISNVAIVSQFSGRLSVCLSPIALLLLLAGDLIKLPSNRRHRRCSHFIGFASLGGWCNKDSVSFQEVSVVR